MKSLMILFPFLCLLGYFTGVTGQRFSQDDPDSGGASPSSTDPRSRRGEPTEGIPSTIKSNDTAATLADVPATELYDRLALWMLDASAVEMQEFWLSYSLRTDRSNDLNDLVFINWTRVDPEAAIAAAEGTEFANYPWWAWACHEPEKALSEVLARYQGQEDQKHIGEVAWGIGEFHPDWLREHFDELPEEWMQRRALSGYSKWADTENPRESIAFLKEQGWRINPKTLAALGRENPLEAYDLAVELKGDGSNYANRGLPEELIETLANEDPALLGQLKDHIKSPTGKMSIQLKQFEALVASDPEAARKQVEQLSESWVKQDQLAMLATHYLETDPAQATELAARIFEGKGEILDRYTRIHTENGSSGSGAPNELIRDLMQTLIVEDGAHLMDAITSQSGLSKAGELWAENDLPGYAGWVSEQDDPKTYHQGASKVVNYLQRTSHFQEAMEWAESIPAEGEHQAYDQVVNTYYSWFQRDPEAAGTWKQNADLSEGQVEQINRLEQRSR